MTYAQKRLDPRWQKERLEMMGRDEFTCQNCGRTDKTLNVHHRYYVSKRDPWNYPGFALVTLCEDCHKQEQEVAETEIQRWELLLSSIDVDAVYAAVDNARCDRQMTLEQITGAIVEALS